MSDTTALFSQALASHQESKLDDAAALYQRVLRENPRHVDSLHMLGLLSLQAGRARDGIELIHRALALNPANAAIHVTLGNGLRDLGRFDEALASYDAAIAAAPSFAWAWYNRGNALRELGRLEEALASFDKSVALRPDDAVAWYDRGNTQAAMRRPADAVASLDRAIALNPDYVEAYCNRGSALLGLLRYDDAIANFDRAIMLRPEQARLYCNRGNALADSGRSEAALADFDKTVALLPDDTDGHWSKSLCLLRLGCFEQGWRLYEWRKKLAAPVGARSYARPIWTGEQDIAGKVLFVHAEQGLGDTLQFCRYATLAAEAGARVILEVQSSLVELMASLRGVAEVIAEGDSIPDFDLHCPIMSLPLAFNTRLETVPGNVPYLHADSGRAAFWRDRLSGLEGRRVGLVWAGGKRVSDAAASAMDRRRSLPLAAFAPFATVPGCVFVSLQLGPPAHEAASPPPGMLLHDFTGEVASFADTAALIENLDLVIGVDTSTPHLAAAMGKPVWLLNRFDTCWRWLLNRNDSPWYPTMTLFRQERPGDWDGVIQRITGELAR